MDLDNYGPVPAQNYDYVVCSNCGAEFQPHVTRCIDCGAATVPPGAPRVKGRRPVIPQDAEVVGVRIDGDLEWLETVQKRFAIYGIPSRIEPVEGSSFHHPRHEIFVMEKDARRAYELDQKMLRERLGDEAAGLAEIPPPGVCPVCKARLAPGTVECRGCGLVLADADTELGEGDEEDGDLPVLSNLEVVQSFYNALRDGDEDLILGILHPEVEWVQNEGFPDGGSYVGAETVLNEVFLRLGEEWEGWQAAVGRWLNAGDSIVALGAYRGTFRETGKSMQAAFAHVYWLEKGRIVRFEQYADTAKIAEACAGG